MVRSEAYPTRYIWVPCPAVPSSSCTGGTVIRTRLLRLVLITVPARTGLRGDPYNSLRVRSVWMVHLRTFRLNIRESGYSCDPTASPPPSTPGSRKIQKARLFLIFAFLEVPVPVRTPFFTEFTPASPAAQSALFIHAGYEGSYEYSYQSRTSTIPPAFSYI